MFLGSVLVLVLVLVLDVDDLVAPSRAGLCYMYWGWV